MTGKRSEKITPHAENRTLLEKNQCETADSAPSLLMKDGFRAAIIHPMPKMCRTAIGALYENTGSGKDIRYPIFHAFHEKKERKRHGRKSLSPAKPRKACRFQGGCLKNRIQTGRISGARKHSFHGKASRRKIPVTPTDSLPVISQALKRSKNEHFSPERTCSPHDHSNLSLRRP